MLLYTAYDKRLKECHLKNIDPRGLSVTNQEVFFFENIEWNGYENY